LFGAVFGCSTKADSIYASVRDAYAQLKVDSLQFKGKSIMSGMSWRGTWYVPAGGTFMGNLFRDAGAQYKYEGNPSTSSIPLTMEQAIQDFSQADVWVGCEANSLKNLEAIDKKHTWFKAFQTKEVYNFRRRALSSGANDFWESATVHPERVLQDLQKVLKGDTTDLYYMLPLR
jgi:iron complex transport system substrate-binding protein